MEAQQKAYLGAHNPLSIERNGCNPTEVGAVPTPKVEAVVAVIRAVAGN
jgi:hypothetical protein